MNLELIIDLIESKHITSDDFNLFIEGLPKSANERYLRKARLKPGDPIRPVDHSPEKKTIHSLQKVGNNDPTKTSAGRRSVKRQGERNKKNAGKFTEAIDFVINNHNKSIEESINNLSAINDIRSLKAVLNKAMCTSNSLDSDWVYNMKTYIDKVGV